MRVRYTMSPKLAFEFDAPGPKTAFEHVAAIQELFEADTECGCCKSKEIACAAREWQGDTFYSLKCLKCTAELGFLKRNSDGALFVKRNDKEKQPLPNRGWSIYKKKDADAPPSDAPADTSGGFEDRF